MTMNEKALSYISAELEEIINAFINNELEIASIDSNTHELTLDSRDHSKECDLILFVENTYDTILARLELLHSRFMKAHA